MRYEEEPKVNKVPSVGERGPAYPLHITKVRNQTLRRLRKTKMLFNSTALLRPAAPVKRASHPRPRPTGSVDEGFGSLGGFQG